MNKRLLILLMILILALAGAGVWWYLNPDQVKKVLNPSTNSTANANLTGNSNTAPLNANLQTEQKGTSEIDFKTTVNEIEIHFSSASKLAAFAGQPAEDGKAWVLVYFDALPSDKVLTAQSGLTNQLSVLYAGGTSPLISLKVASDVVGGDRGYAKFAVPINASQLKLQVGADSARQVALPL